MLDGNRASHRPSARSRVQGGILLICVIRIVLAKCAVLLVGVVFTPYRQILLFSCVRIGGELGTVKCVE